MMPQVLGKYGMDKKMPIPVRIAQQARDPSAPLVDAIASTVLRTPGGASCGVKSAVLHPILAGYPLSP